MSEFEGEAFTSTREAQQARQGTCGPGALALRPSPSAFDCEAYYDPQGRLVDGGGGG
jgi:hypothetical protein